MVTGLSLTGLDILIPTTARLKGPCLGLTHYTIMSAARMRLVNRIEDVTLGAFGNLQPSETLNHLIRFLSTWNGSECVHFSFFCHRVNLMEGVT